MDNITPPIIAATTSNSRSDPEACLDVISLFVGGCGTDEVKAACNSLIKSPSRSMLRPVGYLLLRTIFQKDACGYLKGKCVDVYPRDHLKGCAKKCPPESHLFCMELLTKVVENGTVPFSYGNGNTRTITGEVRAFCCYLIGGIYLWGIGTAQSYNMAFKYFRAGTDSGCIWCENLLGLCYWHGWGNPCGGSNLGEYYERHKDGLQPCCVPLYEAAACLGSAPAMLNLALMYKKGEGVPKDVYKAEKYMQAAASQGYSWAQSCLANLYESGTFESREIQDSLRLYFFAAAQGCEGAQANVGLMYDSLHSPESRVWRRDMREASKWYRLSISHGGAATGLLKEILNGPTNDEGES
ncbi:hypothetical protein Pelo_14269 [Pelomyxa schiedti]|nr:hypothetical protein Pelo_14269 [Pelomyxa schiedti]